MYSELNRAQLSYEYLHTNSTTHEFLFGALAELVDNGRDAQASRMDIFTETNRSLTGGHMLYFKDDGEGMDPTEAANVIRFGCSIKKGLDSRLIGQYGNGLKSGSMRIGRDMIMFTKKGTTMSCLMISRTFHDDEKIKEVIVPLPSFHVRNQAPLISPNSSKAKERHDTELQLIFKYSPFHTRDQLFAQFKRITSDSGTLICIYNLKLLDSGESELDFKTDPLDILLNGIDESDKSVVPQRRSFRSYVSILYLDPRMKIYIQGSKVQLVKFVHELYKPRCYQYTSARFKTRSKDDVKRADIEAKAASMKAKEAEGKAREMEKQFGSESSKKEERALLRIAHKEAETLKEEAKFKELMAEKKRKALKEPKTLNFIFGVNLENRNMDGLFIYNCCRLIKMNVHSGIYESGNLRRGVVGLVDIPYIVLEPTHNKQDFADAKEYRHLLRALGDHHSQYWRDLELESAIQISKFWESYGYLSSNWSDPPSKDSKFIKKRAMQRTICIQCDACLKWRILPFSSMHIGMKFPEDWKCSLNSDVSHNRCSAAEEKFTIPDGKLKKVEKSKADKQKQIVQEIEKLQGRLDLVQESEDSDDSKEDETWRAGKKSSRKLAKRPSISSQKPSKKQPPPPSNKSKKQPPAPVSVRPARISRQRSSSSSKSYNTIESSDDEDEVATTPMAISESYNELECVEAEVTLKTETVQCEPPAKEPVKSKPDKKAKDVEVQPSKRKIDKVVKDDSSVVEKTAAKAKEVPSGDCNEPLPKRICRSSSVSSETTDEKKKSPDHPMTWPDEELNSTNDLHTQFIVGCRVEARVCQKWYFGTIVDITKNVARVKFEKYPDAVYDKQFPLDSAELKLAINEKIAQPHLNCLNSLEACSQDTPHEMPSSSTSNVGQQMSVQDQLMDDIARGFRTCLHYFLPPQWKMDKDSVNSLSLRELASFPLDDFFDNYEKGLKKLVSGFQMDSVLRKREAERAEASLKNTTRLIVRLLNIIHGEYNLDPEKDREKLDNVLLACVQQAEEDAKANQSAKAAKVTKGK